MTPVHSEDFVLAFHSLKLFEVNEYNPLLCNKVKLQTAARLTALLWLVRRCRELVLKFPPFFAFLVKEGQVCLVQSVGFQIFI